MHTEFKPEKAAIERDGERIGTIVKLADDLYLISQVGQRDGHASTYEEAVAIVRRGTCDTAELRRDTIGWLGCLDGILKSQAGCNSCFQAARKAAEEAGGGLAAAIRALPERPLAEADATRWAATHASSIDMIRRLAHDAS